MSSRSTSAADESTLRDFSSKPKPSPRKNGMKTPYANTAELDKLEDLNFSSTTSEDSSVWLTVGHSMHSQELTGDLFDRKEIIAREQEMERKRKEDNQNQNFDFETSKQQLSKTAELCLKLAEQLDSKSLCQQPKSSEHNKLKSENQQLKQQLGEVIDANLHWQKYNVERDNYVISLQNALKSKQTQKCACASRVPADVLTVAQQKEVDKILLNAKAKTSSIEKEKEQLQDSIRDLRLTIHQQNQEIENLKKSAARNQDQHRSSNRSNDDDYVNMLKEQIRAVTEDFEAERRDREEAHSKILELEIQLRQLRNSRSNFKFYHQGNTVVDG